MKDFIFVPGHAINPAAISHIRYNKDGSAHVTVGKDTLIFQGDEAKVFFDAATPKPSLVPTTKSAPAAAPAKTDPPKPVE